VSWAGVRSVRATLNPSFDSRLPATEDTILDETDPTEKAQAQAHLQNAIAMDAMVQCMGEMDKFHCVLLSMKEDVDWPIKKAWKTWKSIKNHYHPTDTTASRDLTLALQKIKLRRDADLVQGCAGDDYAQIIVVTDKVS
jgi:hypothetical protein